MKDYFKLAVVSTIETNWYQIDNLGSYRMVITDFRKWEAQNSRKFCQYWYSDPDYEKIMEAHGKRR